MEQAINAMISEGGPVIPDQSAQLYKQCAATCRAMAQSATALGLTAQAREWLDRVFYWALRGRQPCLTHEDAFRQVYGRDPYAGPSPSVRGTVGAV